MKALTPIPVPKFEDYESIDKKLAELCVFIKQNGDQETEKVRMITKNSEERILSETALTFIGNAIQIEGLNLWIEESKMELKESKVTWPP